jgi:hypothetical protein
MIFLKVFFLGLLLLIIGGFTYFAVTDIPIHQTEKVETIRAQDFQAQ